MAVTIKNASIWDGMRRCVALVTADVSEDLVASIIRVKIISELGTLAITSNCQLRLTLFLAL
jgi:hypothetical protein